MITDIFAPYKIAKQLKEIGFDEPCIAFYYYKRLILTRKKATDIAESDDIIKAPTWEQVFKWFRERRYLFVIGYDFSAKKYNYRIVIKRHDGASCITSENYSTYEQARENLALELIEIYKNEQRTNKK